MQLMYVSCCTELERVPCLTASAIAPLWIPQMFWSGMKKVVLWKMQVFSEDVGDACLNHNSIFPTTTTTHPFLNTSYA